MKMSLLTAKDKTGNNNLISNGVKTKGKEYRPKGISGVKKG